MSKVPIPVLPVNIVLPAVTPGPMFTVVIVVAILSNALLVLELVLFIVTLVKLGLFENESPPTVVTVAGKTIDVKLLYLKASIPIIVTEGGITKLLMLLYSKA